MLFKSAIRLLDPVNFHESLINFTPHINEHSYVIKKTGQVALSALVAVSGLFAATREFGVGTARILPWLVVRIPIGVIRCFKSGFAEKLSKELAFKQIERNYLRGVVQLIGVAGAITALVTELSLFPLHLGANQNYALQVLMGNVKVDERAVIKKKHEERRTAAEEAEIALWKKRFGLDGLVPKSELEAVNASVKTLTEDNQLLKKVVVEQLYPFVELLGQNANQKEDLRAKQQQLQDQKITELLQFTAEQGTSLEELKHSVEILTEQNQSLQEIVQRVAPITQQLGKNLKELQEAQELLAQKQEKLSTGTKKLKELTKQQFETLFQQIEEIDGELQTLESKITVNLLPLEVGIGQLNALTSKHSEIISKQADLIKDHMKGTGHLNESFVIPDVSGWDSDESSSFDPSGERYTPKFSVSQTESSDSPEDDEPHSEESESSQSTSTGSKAEPVEKKVFVSKYLPRKDSDKGQGSDESF